MTHLVFVHALDSKRQPAVASIYEFAHLPRSGEEIVIDERARQHILKVRQVRHFHLSKGSPPSENAHLECDLVDTIEL